ncbi:hypothetical protein [Altererythrobacter sp. Root672]|uniref:hypothetical protein n=1 Tax=Altererythrobacter sp. Root672 TaxID=1736584 RepID=UPI0006F2B92B|nr:hypothetical protein [Altererythrobacter sp. Root672]KRA82719.1 hypothetical protein ASD76_01085 [Altererythrobacter sp. Root672]
MMKLKLLAGAAAMALALPATAQAQDCDRACLIAMADTYAAALVAHDPSKAPLASNVVTVENIKKIGSGEGLWRTATKGPTEYQIHVADPVSQQVGLLAMMEVEGKPALVGIRLKREGGKIVEAEHMVAGNLSEGQLNNLRAPRPALMRPVSEEYADSRGRLIHIGKSYYDALDNNNGSLTPFSDDCERRENGFQTARNPMVRNTPGGNGQTDPAFAYLGGLGCEAQMDTNMWEYIDTIENRRVDIADTETGLVWGMSHFHHDMKEERYRLLGVPGTEYRVIRASTGAGFDMPAIHIYKVWGGQMHEIEAIGIVTPYMSPSGWEK